MAVAIRDEIGRIFPSARARKETAREREDFLIVYGAHKIDVYARVIEPYFNSLSPNPSVRLYTGGALRPCLVSKKFQDFPSHRLLQHMHRVLNLHKNKN